MTTALPDAACSVLSFWFEDSTPQQWFAKDDAFDAAIRQRFANLHHEAAQAQLWPWRTTPSGRLAEILVLDQFSRNLHRDSAQAFVCDGMALVLAQEAVAAQADAALPVDWRAFVYMPYMHSESLAVQDESVALFTRLGNPNNLDFAVRHRDIVARFGRFPHRNAVLGRASTAEETAFLREPGSAF
ncbi:DUF924 family protein [Paracidovorax valerianellae]|uniref:Uncharacterized conserved protein, DUF924 family n=1 Tax=Paracidovorax valerianellae TaxID=187868 RepID=A0A1G6SBA0_9BURK|nr:DUF924 family protein [Paracidovorax valerianellae]MDA8444226.1 DUF924 domain-containing protein [Paracidovorax valerianellae]SDD13407.1 Uncharacterized conserved protein, DUF924 family [Paracidovorax valerianellae]